jgi:opacity protein-like surface antigen
MNKKSLLASLVLIVAGLAYLTPAAAQMQQSPWYIGGAIGQSRARDVCNDASLFGGRASCDYKDVAWRFLGGYQVNRSFAMELAYTDLGRASVPGLAIKANSWDLVGVGLLPVGPVSLLGKLGLMRGTAECQGCGGVNLEETTTNVTWGAGLQFDMSPRFAVRGEWQRYNNLGGGGFNAKYDVDAWTLGGLYRF